MCARAREGETGPRAEIVYFSLAKRRKIKGKQETAARDGGNQAGLRLRGWIFPGRALGIEWLAGWLAGADRRSGTRYTTPVTNRDLSMVCNVHVRDRPCYTYDFNSDFSRILAPSSRILVGIWENSAPIVKKGELNPVR